MTKRKIKIVDVDTYEDLQLQIQYEEVKPEPMQESIQEVKVVKKRQPSVKRMPKAQEPVEQEPTQAEPVLKRQPSVKKVKPVEEVKQEPIQEVEEGPIQEPVKPDKKVRVQELVECPDCNKMITPKSFKYSHNKNVRC